MSHERFPSACEHEDEGCLQDQDTPDNPTLIRSSRMDVKELVDERLKSPWGRPVHPVPPGCETSLMHQWISCIRPSSTTQQEQQRNHPNWESIEGRCRTHPHEAAHLDRRGRTCLHAACAKKPPVSTVLAILEACGRHGDTILERDKHGRTPLTIAISSNADLEVIAKLLEKSPKAATAPDHLGHLPLHLACAGYDAGQVELVIELLEVFPGAASQESFNGRTPLHSAMEGNAPVQVVEQLVRVCPESVVNDGCGLNPLFVAIRFNADVGVIRCLVQAYPSCTLARDRGNGLPLRRAIENQSPVEIQACLCTSPEVVLDADAYVHNTALHGALECGTAREATVELLVQTAPEIALTRSKSGQTPLNLACQRWQRVRSHQRRDEAHLRHLWRMVQCLMRAAFYGKFQGDGQDAPTLHAALSLQTPLDVVLHAMEACGEEIRLQDPQGRYALQLAVENRPPVDYPMSLTTVETYLKQKEVQILKVLELCPEVASLPNADGRLALSLAAGANSVSECVLQELWQVDPAGLRKLDPLFRLYPFQVAALPKSPLPMITYSERAAEQWRETEDLLHLSSIYTLLRQAPDLIHLRTEKTGSNRDGSV